MRVKIAASIIAADFRKLDEEIVRISRSGVDIIHVDVYPTILAAYEYSSLNKFLVGHILVDFVRRRTELPVDVHLAIAPTDYVVNKCIDYGAESLSFHPEVIEDPLSIVEIIKSRGVKVGLAFTVYSNLSIAEALVSHVDFLLAVTVDVQFGGQVAQSRAFNLVKGLNDIRGGKTELMVDGGVNPGNIAEYTRLGANIFVVGKYLFEQDNPERAVRILRDKALGR